jgi:hypothetical protein
MRLTRIRWWQWLVFSVLFGLGAVALRQWITTDPDPTGFLPDLSSQQVRFERALFRKVQSYPLLQNIRVSTPQIMESKKGRQRVNVVHAKYCTGESEDIDGQQRLVWHESLLVLPIPYKLQTNLADAPDVARRLQSIASPTVIDLLAAARPYGISYSYSLWDDHPYLTFVPTSVAVLGLLIPALFRILAPAEPEPTSAPTPAPTPSTKPAARPARKEAPAPVAPAPTASKDYRMKQDDYYPTEKGESEHHPVKKS